MDMFPELRGPFIVAGPLEVDPDGSEQMEYITDERFADIDSATAAVQQWIRQHGREPGDIWDESFRPSLHVRTVWANTYEQHYWTETEIKDRGFKRRRSPRRDNWQLLLFSIPFVTLGVLGILVQAGWMAWAMTILFGGAGLVALVEIVRGNRPRS